jgi:2-oxoglutarate/2-oxoacid ferredoxin oxidoreductase subunit beta
MGDGDCTSIGAAHWLHATRYNMDMTALMLDNNIYGLTKNQTSPTTPQGITSNTQPRGSYLPPLNPIEATLGITNASFVAQTAEWVPAHMYATLRAAHRTAASRSCASCSAARSTRRRSSSSRCGSRT